MTHVPRWFPLVALGVLLAACALVPAAASAAPPGQAAEWSRLATLPAGSPIVVTLVDGRRLERLIVSAGSNALVVVDVTRLSRSDRDTVVEMLRSHPSRFLASAAVRVGDRNVEIVERFDSRSVLAVERPATHRVQVPRAASWFLATSGPCPNCDPRQTLFGSTVLPSPLRASAPVNRTGELLYNASPGQRGTPQRAVAWPLRGHQPFGLPAVTFTPRSMLDDQKQEKKSPPNVTGKWTMTMEMSMGTASPTLDLKQDGTKIGGTYTGRYGTFEIQGTLKDRAIQFSFEMSAEGEARTMTFAGEVAEDGQSMKGTATLAEMGDATWTAKKEKQ